MADLNQKLKELFRKVNISGERSEFHARKQRVGESITNYMSSLRELASSCNFGTMEDDMTCVQLVEFNNNSQVREKLVSKTYTLEQAVQIAKEIEKGANTARDMLQKAATSILLARLLAVLQPAQRSNILDLPQRKAPSVQMKPRHLQGRREVATDVPPRSILRMIPHALQ